MHVVDLNAVTKRFGTTVAVDSIDLHIESGAAVAILGPNGAGKTTSISLMLGLRKPTLGSVRLWGLAPWEMRARSMSGVMLQKSGVPQFLKVREVIDLFRTYYPAPLATGAILETTGLTDKANSLSATLSGGETQRLYFALAIAGDPGVLFLDEPSVGLDVEGRRALWNALRVMKSAGKTIVLTTHYLEEADALAERIVIIYHGKIVADGAPATIKSRVGAKRLSFKTNEVLNPGDFADLPVQQYRLSDSAISMLSAQPELVLKALFERGYELRDLEVGGASLEEAFLALIDAPQGAESARDA